MRVAVFVDAFPLPSETFVLKEITGLLDRGCEVDILVNRSVTVGMMHPDVAAYCLESHIIHPHHFPNNPVKRSYYGFIHLMKNYGRSPKLFRNSLNFSKYGRQAANLSLMFQGSSFRTNGPYDVIHCHFGTNGIRGLRLREIGAIEGKLVTTFHGHDVSAYVRKKGRDCYQKLFQQGDLFIAISPSMKSHLIDLGCNPNKIVILPIGVDLQVFSRSSAGRPQSTVIDLVSIGRLIPKKGLAYGLEAFAKLVHKGFNVRYKIVGDGPLKPDLKSLALNLNVADKVDFLGWKSEPDLVKILEGSDILIAPSVTGPDGDQEGTPVVILEAMAMELPVISTRHSGIPDIVQDCQSGFLIPEKDVGALTQRIAELAASTDLRFQMGQIGRGLIESNHNLAELNDSLRNIFRNLLHT